jgi:hypothetical protein
VPSIFIEGIEIEVGDTFIRIVGWVQLQTVEYQPPERRIVARAVMPMSTARALIRDLRKGMAKGGH